MSNEVSQQPSSIGSTIATYGMFPAIFTTAGAIKAVKDHGGIKKVIHAQKVGGKAFESLDAAIKQQETDVFTRSTALAHGYDRYKDLYQAQAKANRKYEQFIKKFGETGDKIPLKTRFTNLFRKTDKKLTHDSIKKALGEKAEINANGLLKNGKKSAYATAHEAISGVKVFDENTAKKLDSTLELTGVSKDAYKKAQSFTQEAITAGAKTSKKAAAKATAKGFGKTVANNFKNELGWKNGKFNYFMTAVQFIPNIIKDVIPAFKEEGFIGGLKATGKTLVRAAADLVGFAAGGSVGRAIGSAIGLGVSFLTKGIIPKGTATRIGGNIGDMIGSMIVGCFVTKKVDKMVGADEESQMQAQQEKQLAQAQYEAQAQAQYEAQMQAQAQAQMQTNNQANQNPQDNATSQEGDIYAQYAHLPSREQVKQAAYAQAFSGKSQFNRYYA